jgi:hypothetical protein
VAAVHSRNSVYVRHILQQIKWRPSRSFAFVATLSFITSSMLSAHHIGGEPYKVTTSSFTNTSSCKTFVPTPSLSSTVSSVTKSKASILRKTTQSVVSTWLAASDWLMAWTPCCLVVSYFVVCTAIFVMCSTRAITVFYYFYMIANLYIAIVAVIESFLGLSPVRKAQAAAAAAQDENFPTASEQDLPTMNMVMVAYLPNEKDIVVGQLMYALEELAYPKEKLQISESFYISRAITLILMTLLPSSCVQHTGTHRANRD